MAFSQTHCRSISLPSRLHPISPTNVEAEIEKLKHCAANSEAIRSAVVNLAELYVSVEEITVQSHQQDEASMEESLSSSVEFLDACDAIREVLQMMKENIQVLQSSLRRKGVAGPTDVAAYLCCRKRANKSIAKVLKSLKKSQQSMVKNNGDGSVLIREVGGVTTSVFKTVLVFLSLPAARSWPLVSKLMIGKSGRELCGDVNEVESVDSSLSSLQKLTSIDGARVLDLQKRLQNLESVIEGFEGGFEMLFRQLVRIRVTLLNILTDH